MGRINQKGTRMVKDGEDSHGLKMTNLKSLGKIFQDAQTVTSSFKVTRLIVGN